MDDGCCRRWGGFITWGEKKMKLFSKPNWLRPEINKPIYYLHLLIIAVVVLGVLQYFQGGEMFTIKNILWSIPLLLAGDLVAHSILRLN